MTPPNPSPDKERRIHIHTHAITTGIVSYRTRFALLTIRDRDRDSQGLRTADEHVPYMNVLASQHQTEHIGSGPRSGANDLWLSFSARASARVL